MKAASSLVRNDTAPTRSSVIATIGIVVVDCRAACEPVGPNVTITQKDPSGLNALLFASLALSSGRASAMLAGAVDEWNPVYARGFDRVGALRGAKRVSGIVQGEGGFAVLLEDGAAAEARGALAGLPVAAAAVVLALLAGRRGRLAPRAVGVLTAVVAAVGLLALPSQIWPSDDAIASIASGPSGSVSATSATNTRPAIRSCSRAISTSSRNCRLIVNVRPASVTAAEPMPIAIIAYTSVKWT